VGEPADILVIDDDPRLCATVGDVLEHRGHRVRTACKGQEALAQLVQQPVDLAIVDFKLPDVSGVDLLESIKATSPETAVILISGHASLGSALAAINREASSYLIKPLDIEQLVGVVDRALAKQCRARAHADRAGSALENERLYQTLKASQERLVETERLHAAGALASGVTNYVNNVLQALLGRVQLVLQRLDQPAVIHDLEVSERTILEAGQVLRRLRRFCEVQTLSSAEPMDLNRLVRQAVEVSRANWEGDASASEGRLEVVTEPGDIPGVAGQPMAFLEVLSILLTNAVEALPAGGEITIRTWQAEGAVHCAVEDSGIGMSEDVRRRAMEPFFTTKGPERKGLGLSVAYGIIRRHQGEIEIASVEGAGTLVTLHLPVVTRVRYE
jgi:two-component system, NtrC family, sensor histidine kinase HydH